MTSDRSHLIPVPVTDKNGVTSTKWKRSEASTQKQPLLPSVQPALGVSHWSLLRKDHRLVSQILLNTTARIIKAQYRREEMMSHLSPDTLDILNKHHNQHHNDANANDLDRFIKECVREESVISLNNAAALIGCADDRAFSYPGNYPGDFFNCITGLRKYQGDEDIDYSVLGEGEREIGMALVLSAGMLNKDYIVYDMWTPPSPRYLKSDNLVALIKRRPKDYLLITSVLLERGLRVDTSEDINRLEELLAESQLAPLRDGAL